MKKGNNLTGKVLAEFGRAPKGTPLSAKQLLHLGSRAAVDQSLSRLCRQGELLRLGRGTYVAPVSGRFGQHAPAPSTVVTLLGAQTGETVVRHGASSASSFGLTTQVPVREVYLTSGPTRTLQFGNQSVELRHAPKWQTILPGKPAGEAIRALAWLGPEEAATAMSEIVAKLPNESLADLMNARGIVPTWVAQTISSAAAAHAAIS